MYIALFASAKLKGTRLARRAETISAQMIYLVTELRVKRGGNDPDLAAMELALQTNVR